MYSNRSFNEKVTTRMHNEDYDLCNTETGQKIIIQWTPQNRGRFLSTNWHMSPRSLSKSVPRRSRGIVRYNINRSLNFNIGSHQRSHNFKSPNSSSESNASVDNNNYLSRSAKILRALNIDYSPLINTSLGVRKNLDLSPSPTRLVKWNKRMCNASIQGLVSPLSKINKTLNFETSSSESNIRSGPQSSVESIDENQNRTLSQRNGKAKKSLNYPSPKFKSDGPASPSMNVHSLMLHSDLRNKIDVIIQSNMTPNFQSSMRHLMKNELNDFGASTPRNLFNDFHDDDQDDEVDNRPQTSMNFLKITPEGMSVIKKSHQKERVLSRLGTAIVDQVKSCLDSESITDIAIDMEPEGDRPTTLVDTSSLSNNPQCNVNLIMQSHKNEKRKGKSCVYNSEDDMSETGSIFDYSETNAISDANDSLNVDQYTKGTEFPGKQEPHVFEEVEEKYQESSLPGSKVSSYAGATSLVEDNICNTPVTDSPETLSDDPTAILNADQLQVAHGATTEGMIASSVQITGSNNAITTPGKSIGNSPRPGTPENRVNFLQRIMTDSIKKSHKKIKDSNKKLLFKPRTIQNDAEQDSNVGRFIKEDIGIVGQGDRAATPENTNSSRLLLSQFSSVKKSHRKDKHRRIESGSLLRKNFFGGDGEATSTSDCKIHNCSVSSSINDFSSLSPPRIALKSATPEKTNSSEFSSFDNSSYAHCQSLQRSSLDGNIYEAGVDALPILDFSKSSPIKRKSFSDDSPMRMNFQTSMNERSVCMLHDSPEEEFKIFTPIKKRKSLNLVTPIARRIYGNTDTLLENGQLLDEVPIENFTTRCSTPTTSRDECLELINDSFKTPDRRASGIFISITDYSTPVLHETDNVSGDSSGGRLTPQNQSTSVLMSGIYSIKKSHKKDKRGNVSKRSLICAQESEYESELTSSFQNNLSKSLLPSESPRSSTSYENHRAIDESENGTNEQTKTPPNCLKAKTYLRLLQTASIKRSHKKVRQRKKYTSIVVDSELSNNGSIFDEAERSINVDVGSTRGSQTEEKKYTYQLCALRTGSPAKYAVHNYLGDKNRLLQGATTSGYSGNVSNGDSISNAEEKHDSLFENSAYGESGDDNPF